MWHTRAGNSRRCSGTKLVAYREVVVTETTTQPAHPAQQATVVAAVHNPGSGYRPTHDSSGDAARVAPVHPILRVDRQLKLCQRWSTGPGVHRGVRRACR